jgi:hypothetical protein
MPSLRLSGTEDGASIPKIWTDEDDVAALRGAE